MKKSSFATTLLMLFLPVMLFAQEGKYIKIPIAFYNVENLFDNIKGENNDLDFTPQGSYSWTREKYDKKRSNIARVISQIAGKGPAVIGLAEVENRGVLENLVNEPALKPLNYSIVHYESPDLRGIDCAILYNPQVFKLIQSGKRPVLFPDKPDWKTRDVVYATGTIGGETFHIIVAHWPSRVGGESVSAPRRLKAAQTMKAVADSLLTIYPNSNAILMGDFNDDPVSPSLVHGIGVKDTPSEVGYKEYYTPMTRLYNRGIGTLAYRDTWNLFDIIVVNGNLLGDDYSKFKLYTDSNGDRGFIFRKDYMVQQTGRYKGYPRRGIVSGRFDSEGFSDHFPVYIYVVRKIN